MSANLQKKKIICKKKNSVRPTRLNKPLALGQVQAANSVGYETIKSELMIFAGTFSLKVFAVNGENVAIER